MKYLVAFALIAMASALPEPIRLLQPVELPQPDLAPLRVPQEVMDEVALLVKFVEEAVNADTAEAVYAPEPLDAAYAVNFVNEVPEAVYSPESLDVSAYAVKIVEEPIAEASEAVALETNDAEFAVHFVDETVNADAPEAVNADAAEAVYAPEPLDVAAYAVNFVNEVPEAVYSPESLDASAYAVKIVEAPIAEDSEAETNNAEFAVHFVDEAVNADAPIAAGELDALRIVDAPVETVASDYSVKFVEAPEVNEDAPIQLKIVDIPLPEPIVLPLAQPIVLPSIDAVKIAESPLEVDHADLAVKFVDFADETPSYRPIKVYDDARLR